MLYPLSYVGGIDKRFYAGSASRPGRAPPSSAATDGLPSESRSTSLASIASPVAPHRKLSIEPRPVGRRRTIGRHRRRVMELSDEREQRLVTRRTPRAPKPSSRVTKPSTTRPSSIPTSSSRWSSIPLSTRRCRSTIVSSRRPASSSMTPRPCPPWTAASTTRTASEARPPASRRKAADTEGWDLAPEGPDDEDPTTPSSTDAGSDAPPRSDVGTRTHRVPL